jgi:hypothetical protein
VRLSIFPALKKSHSGADPFGGVISSNSIFKNGEIATKYQAIAATFAVCVLAVGGASMPACALTCDQQTTLPRPIPLGVSGGNINAFSSNHKFCFVGTLGSLVQDGSANQYILSNNHVLADINIAQPGELIVQPGLGDTAPACTQTPGDAVATFTRTVDVNFAKKSTNTIDAAIAEVDAGKVSPEILNIGGIAGTVATPSVGLAVQKMGRSTCLTTGKISSVNGNFKISYGAGQVAKFIHQIVINGRRPPNNFGGPGDSGSLIATQDACPQAVALLFAGSGNQKQTIANPIADLLSGLGVSMVGSCTPAAAPSTAQPEVVAGDVGMSKDVVDSATAVRDRHEDELMNIPGAVGTAIGMSDQPGQPAIEVYVKKMTPQAQAAAPKEVEGVPVKLIENGGFVAY